MVYTDDDDGSSSISDDDDLQLDHHNSRVTDNFVLNYSFEDCFSMWSSLVDGVTCLTDNFPIQQKSRLFCKTFLSIFYETS